MELPEIDTRRLYSLFSDMVDHYSPSGKEEELSAYLLQYLEDFGLQVVKRDVDETRYNLEVRAPEAGSTEKKSPDVLFLGHIDTVPAFDIDHYDLTEKDGRCYGLGTADMKSGCAAMIEAFVTAHQAGALPDGALLCLVVGEEEYGDGTQAMLDHHGTFPWALVAEPTDMRPCLGHYGYIEMVVRIFGYRRHAAMAKRETSTIRKMLKLLLRFEDALHKENPGLILNMRDLHSSESGFAVPDRCAASMDLHIPPGQDVYRYAGTLDKLISTILTETSAGTTYEVGFPTLANGFSMDEADPGSFPDLLKELYGAFGLEWNPSQFTSHSDANLLQEAGCRPVILGPGQLARAHTIDESVEFRQVVQASRLYTGILASLPPQY